MASSMVSNPISRWYRVIDIKQVLSLKACGYLTIIFPWQLPVDFLGLCPLVIQCSCSYLIACCCSNLVIDPIEAEFDGHNTVNLANYVNWHDGGMQNDIEFHGGR